MIISIFPVIVALLGLILFFAARSNSDVKEIGRILFFIGMFFVTAQLASKVVKLGTLAPAPDGAVELSQK